MVNLGFYLISKYYSFLIVNRSSNSLGRCVYFLASVPVGVDSRTPPACHRIPAARTRTAMDCCPAAPHTLFTRSRTGLRTCAPARYAELMKCTIHQPQPVSESRSAPFGWAYKPGQDGIVHEQGYITQGGLSRTARGTRNLAIPDVGRDRIMRTIWVNIGRGKIHDIKKKTPAQKSQNKSQRQKSNFDDWRDGENFSTRVRLQGHTRLQDAEIKG